MIAFVASAVGNWMVKLPPEDDLSPPNANTATALFD
jgi:hypothetical protein